MCGCKILTGTKRDTYVIKFCPLHENANRLVKAAECFAFEVDEYNDSEHVGTIMHVSISAGEVRRLNEALAATKG